MIIKPSLIRRVSYPTALVLVVSALSGIQYTHAAGFQLGVHSTEGMGRAYAGETADDSPLASLRNPATILLNEEGAAMSNAFNIVKLNYEIDVTKNPYSSVQVPLRPGTHEVKMEADLDDAGTLTPIPAFAYVKNTGDFGFGLSQGVHFAYELDPKEISSIGDSFADIYIKIAHFTSNLAFKVNDQVNVGVGISALPAFFKADRRAGEVSHVIDEAKKIGNGIPLVDGAVDTVINGALGGLNDPSATVARFNGSDIGWGWNFGVTYEPSQNTRFGLAYHNKSKLKYEGDYFSDLAEIPTLTNPLNGDTLINIPQATGGKKLDAIVNMTIPSWLEFGAWHRINERLEAHFTARYTAWKESFQGVTVEAEGGKGAHFDVLTNDTTFVSAGLTYKMDDKITLRGGMGLDDSFISQENAILNAPDNNRVWMSTGLTYDLSDRSSLDFGLSYIAFEKTNIKENSTLFDQLGDASDVIDIPGVLGINDSNIELEADTDTSIYMVGVQYNKKF
ncbi:MAG: outer membrane protein transport protein [Pseudomonadota bacterium]